VRAFFYDTWAFLALANRRDRHHPVAVEADEWLQARRYAAVTSDYVIDETLTALALLDLLEQRIEGGDLLLVGVDTVRRARAAGVFRRLAPEVPRISFTDCATIAVMRELGITLAFSIDRHFHHGGGGIRPIVEIAGDGAVLRLPD